MFQPVNQYTLQVERFSRLLLGHDVPSWPIEDALRCPAEDGPVPNPSGSAKAGTMEHIASQNVAYFPDEINFMVALREQEITKIPVIRLRHCERSAAIHGGALRAMAKVFW